MTDQGRHDGPPGRALWLAAERHRVEKEWSKGRLVKEIGIGRVTFDRLFTQENPPIARTVKKVADAIGISYEDAAALAGMPGPDVSVVDLSAPMDVPMRETRINLTGARREIQKLREIAERAKQTLGDILIGTGLAEPEELELTKNDVVREIENDDLPDDIRQEFLDGYRRLKEQVVESARRRESSSG